MKKIHYTFAVHINGAKRAVKRNAVFLNKVTREQKDLLHLMKKHIKKM